MDRIGVIDHEENSRESRYLTETGHPALDRILSTDRTPAERVRGALDAAETIAKIRSAGLDINIVNRVNDAIGRAVRDVHRNDRLKVFGGILTGLQKGLIVDAFTQTLHDRVEHFRERIHTGDDVESRLSDIVRELQKDGYRPPDGSAGDLPEHAERWNSIAATSRSPREMQRIQDETIRTLFDLTKSYADNMRLADESPYNEKDLSIKTARDNLRLLTKWASSMSDRDAVAVWSQMERMNVREHFSLKDESLLRPVKTSKDLSYNMNILALANQKEDARRRSILGRIFG